jgi:hypothetical protein
MTFTQLLIVLNFCYATDGKAERPVAKVPRYHVTTGKVQVEREISIGSSAPIVTVNARVVQLTITVVPVPCRWQEKSKK